MATKLYDFYIIFTCTNLYKTNLLIPYFVYIVKAFKSIKDGDGMEKVIEEYITLTLHYNDNPTETVKIQVSADDNGNYTLNYK